MKLRDKARQFAIHNHGDQKYGDRPYAHHLDAVVGVLEEFGGVDDNIIAAGYLHDVLEDTGVGFAQLEHEFGVRIAWIVWGVTDEPGKNRKERHEKTYPKTRNDVQAVQLKLADRIANCRECAKDPKSSLAAMYRKEYPDFVEALWRHDEFPAMWAELDRLLEFEAMTKARRG